MLGNERKLHFNEQLSSCCDVPGERVTLSAGWHGAHGDAFAGHELGDAGFDRLCGGRRWLLLDWRRGCEQLRRG